MSVPSLNGSDDSATRSIAAKKTLNSSGNGTHPSLIQSLFISTCSNLEPYHSDHSVRHLQSFRMRWITFQYDRSISLYINSIIIGMGWLSKKSLGSLGGKKKMPTKL